MKNLKLILLLMLGASLTFTSCEKSSEEIMDSYLHYATDLQQMELYGKIKQMTRTIYSESKWVNNTLQSGYVDDEIVSEFNKDGYYTKISVYESYLSDNVWKLRIDRERTYEGYDNKNRATVVLSKYYDFSDNPSVISYEKTTYQYDDKAKTAVEIIQSSEDGSTWTDDYKMVYQLNKAGRIDWNQYEYFPATRAFDETAGGKEIMEYDDKGNPVLNYTVILPTGTVYSHWVAKYMYY